MSLSPFSSKGLKSICYAFYSKVYRAIKIVNVSKAKSSRLEKNFDAASIMKIIDTESNKAGVH
jgi:hypothetical protein